VRIEPLIVPYKSKALGTPDNDDADRRNAPHNIKYLYTTSERTSVGMRAAGRTHVLIRNIFQISEGRNPAEAHGR
jgi:hypothetical protein